eukprot:Amastigsp_a3647_5.p4 type:complete len:102 gc:universal Amastigsp_a3647_5:437-132(-)
MVPTVPPIEWSPLFSSREKPKSATRARSSRSTRMLGVLRSRCQMHCLWRYFMPSMTSITNDVSCARVRVSVGLARTVLSPPSAHHSVTSDHRSGTPPRVVP